MLLFFIFFKFISIDLGQHFDYINLLFSLQHDKNINLVNCKIIYSRLLYEIYIGGVFKKYAEFFIASLERWFPALGRHTYKLIQK